MRIVSVGILVTNWVGILPLSDLFLVVKARRDERGLRPRADPRLRFVKSLRRHLLHTSPSPWFLTPQILNYSQFAIRVMIILGPSHQDPKGVRTSGSDVLGLRLPFVLPVNPHFHACPFQQPRGLGKVGELKGGGSLFLVMENGKKSPGFQLGDLRNYSDCQLSYKHMQSGNEIRLGCWGCQFSIIKNWKPN